jgi:hypothetical protein
MKKILEGVGVFLAAGLAVITLTANPARAATVETVETSTVTVSTTTQAYWWSSHRIPGGISFAPRSTLLWNNKKNLGDGDWFGGGQIRWYGGGVATNGEVPWLGLEFSADYRRVVEPVSGQRQDQFPLHGDAMYYFSPNHISPYVIGGVAWLVGTDSVESRWGPEAGAGLQLWVTEVLSLNMDWRHMFMIGSNSGPHNVAFDSNSVTMGLNIHFGGAEPQPKTTTETQHERTIIHETP